MNQNKRAAIRRWYWLRKVGRKSRFSHCYENGKRVFVSIRKGEIEIRMQRRIPGFDVLGAYSKTMEGDQVHFVGIDPKGHWEPVSEWLWPGVLVGYHVGCIFRRKRSWAPKAGGGK
jgi:hypothetical protein